MVLGGLGFASCTGVHLCSGWHVPSAAWEDLAGKLLAPCHPSFRREGTERVVMVAPQELAWFW